MKMLTNFVTLIGTKDAAGATGQIGDWDTLFDFKRLHEQQDRASEIAQKIENGIFSAVSENFGKHSKNCCLKMQ